MILLNTNHKLFDMRWEVLSVLRTSYLTEHPDGNVRFVEGWVPIIDIAADFGFDQAKLVSEAIAELKKLPDVHAQTKRPRLTNGQPGRGRLVRLGRTLAPWRRDFVRDYLHKVYGRDEWPERLTGALRRDWYIYDKYREGRMTL
jgi:hypothetical protein